MALTLLFGMGEGKISNANFFYNKTRPFVVAHRGSSGQFPEHSLGAYSSAYFYGADYVELDLQITKDGHLVTNHDPCLKETTNVEEFPEFANRMGNYTFLPYTNVYSNDFLIHDFTLAELKILRRRMRYSTRNPYLNQDFQILTLDETIELMLDLNTKHPRTDIAMKVGLYMETKMYNFYLEEFGQDIALMTYDVLKKYNLNTVQKAEENLPIIIECFEKEALIEFGKVSDLPLVYLMFWKNPNVEYDLEEINQYAHGVGPQQEWIFMYKNESFSFESDSLFI